MNERGHGLVTEINNTALYTSMRGGIRSMLSIVDIPRSKRDPASNKNVAICKRRQRRKEIKWLLTVSRGEH